MLTIHSSPSLVQWDAPLPLSLPALALHMELPSLVLVSQLWVSYGQILLSRVRPHEDKVPYGFSVYGLTHPSDIVPVIMAGIIGIYGLVVSVLISDGLKQELPLYTGFIQLGAGLSVGLAGLAAG